MRSARLGGTGVNPRRAVAARVLNTRLTRESSGTNANAHAALTAPSTLERKTARFNIQLFELIRANSF